MFLKLLFYLFVVLCGFGYDGARGEPNNVLTESEWGTQANPGKTTCKDAPINKSGTYYVYNSVKVNCDAITKTTCVVLKGTRLEAYISDMKPSWLSSAGIKLSDIYHLSNAQFEWLHERSETASIKIRYYCVNTSPTRKDKEVILKSWNDMLIRPRPTASSALYYEVDKDTCSTAVEDYGGFTDIVIKNTSAHILPIVDIYIQDNVKKDQLHEITVTELCFH